MAMKQRRLTFFAIVVILFLALSLVGARYVLGAWYPFMYIPLAMLILTSLFLLFMHRLALTRFLHHKTTKNSFSSGVLLLFLVCLLLGVNYLGVKMPLVWDVTRSQRLSLAGETSELVKKLRTHFKVMVFHRGTQDRVKLQKLRRLYDLVRSESTMASGFQSLDIYENFDKVQAYLGDIQQRQFDTIIAFVLCNGEKYRVSHPHGEVELAQALNQCFIRKAKVLGSVINHGEWRSTSQGELVALTRHLGDLSISLRDVSLLRPAEISNIDGLLIAGPRTDFLRKELDALENYLDQGGVLLVAIDPDKKSNLTEFLRRYSISTDQKYVLKFTGTTGSSTVEANEFNSQNAIVKPLEGGALFFDLVTSVSSVKGEKGWVTDDLVYSGGNSFAIESLGNMQIEPKFQSHVLALLSEGSDAGKIIVVGDSDWLTDQYFEVFYNKNFFVSAMSYLLDDRSLAVVPSKEIQNEPIYFARMQLAGFFAMCLLVPVILLFGSVLLWWRSRS